MTTENKNTKNLTKATFERFVSHLNGHAENILKEYRSPAFERLEGMGLPAAKNEAYKYTPIQKIIEKNLSLDEALNSKPAFSQGKDSLVASLNLPTIRFENGQIVTSSIEKIQIKGLKISTFNAAQEEDRKTIAEYLDTLVEKETDAFVNLNAAFSRDGLFIQVEKNAVLEQPLHFDFQFDSSESSFAVNPRILILVGDNAEASFIETSTQNGSQVLLNNPVVEIFQGENTHLHFYKLQSGLENQILINHTAIRQKSNSTASVFTFSLDGLCTRNNLQIRVDGQGATANMYGLTLLNGDSHTDHQTVVDHLLPHCDSNELYKTVLAGKAKGVFNGRIFVREGAQKTNAFQANNNILLSDEANINTKPQLEIWADDVKCSHGATIGQLDEEQLFYLRARGIDKNSATSILLHAFAGEVLDHIKHDEVKTLLENLVHESLESL